MSTVETVSGVLEDPRDRTAMARAGAAQRGTAASRWPWAVGAALAGAGVGAAAAYALRRLRPPDAPDALDPDQVQAVVDRPQPAAVAGLSPAP